MRRAQTTLTVFFEDPFWVGIFERHENSKLSVCKVTFGKEPKDCEIEKFVLKHFENLPFSPAVSAVQREWKKNPKRVQREIKKSLERMGIGTKSQQALKLQQEQNKLERRAKSRAEKLAEAQRLFTLKQQKKKEKHKGK